MILSWVNSTAVCHYNSSNNVNLWKTMCLHGVWAHFLFCLKDAFWLHEYKQYRKIHPTTHTCLVTQTLGVPVTSCPLQLSLPWQTASFPWEELWRSRPSCLHRGPSPLQAAQSLYCKAQYRPPPRPFPSSLHSLFTINSFPFYTLLFPPVSPFWIFASFHLNPELLIL